MRYASSQAVFEEPLLPWQWHNLLVSGEEESYGVILLSIALCAWRVPKLYLWQCNMSGESSWSGDQRTQNNPCHATEPCPWTTSKLPTRDSPSLARTGCAGFQALHGSCSVEYQAAWPKPCQRLV